MEDRFEFVTFCGLYCRLCGEQSRIRDLAAELQKAMTEEGWPWWGTTIDGFNGFWEFLGNLEAKGGCPGCRAGGGYPQCRIRPCARQRELDSCSQCPDFPCEHIEELAATYPTLIADNRRLQLVGLEQWLQEQDERVRRGVVYADLRYRAVEPGDSAE